MGRGKHQLTKDKKELRQLTKIALAQMRAQKELDRKDFFDKDMPKWFVEKLGDSIKNIDPMETAAILGMTIVVRGVIMGTAEILDQVLGYGNLTPPPINIPIIGFLTLIPWLMSLDPEKPKEQRISDSDLGIWITSFTIAYILIKNMGAIIGLFGNITGSIRALVGMAAAGGA